MKNHTTHYIYTTHHAYTLLIILGVLLLVPLTARAARQPERRALYDQWKNLSEKQLMKRGYRKVTANEPDSALLFYNVVYGRYLEDPDDEDRIAMAARALNNMGYIMLLNFFDYDKAYSLLSQSLQLFQRYRLTDNLPFVYVNLGDLYLIENAFTTSGNLCEAISCYKKGFYLGAQTRQWGIMMTNMSNLVGVVSDFNTATVLPSIQKEISTFNRLKIPASTPMLKFTRTQIRAYEALTAGRYMQAYDILAGNFKHINSNIDSLRFAVNNNTIMAFCLCKMNRYDDALDLLKQQVTAVGKAGIQDLQADLYHDMMLLCRLKGDKAMAEHYEYLYLKGKEDMVFGHKLGDIEHMRFIGKLNRANEEIRTANEHRHHMLMVLIVIGAFALLTLSFSIIIIRKNRRLRESNRRLYLQFRASMESQKNGDDDHRKEPDGETDATKAVKYKNSNLDDDRRREIIKRILRVFDDKDQLCREDLTLGRLSELTDTPYKLVSQVINEHWQKNFSQLLAEYRIREACRRMQDRAAYGNYTIEAIGTSVGFHSRSHFATTFKHVTGLTPGEYLREAQNP